jgi:hypothetical protein
MRVKATDEGRKAVYLFIAELNGYKGGTPETKAEYGKQCHLVRKLPQLDLNDEHDRSELHVNIWLERLYEELDQYALAQLTGSDFKCSVPIELDASASQMSYMGLLLGDKTLLEATNSCYTGTLNDPWSLEGTIRDMTKCVVMKSTYGSSQTPAELLKDDKIKFNMEQLAILNESMTTGKYASANAFKDFIIRNCNPEESMTVKIWNDTFTINCNRFRNVGDYVVAYDIYDTSSESVKRIKHVHTKRVPDLEQFRRYFVTLLIHNLDSQVMNTVMDKLMDKYEWGIDIHDAIICSPEAAADVRMWYAEELQKIYDNRQEILNAYFNSIGINATSLPEWKQVMNKVTPIDSFVASGWALK